MKGKGDETYIYAEVNGAAGAGQVMRMPRRSLDSGPTCISSETHGQGQPQHFRILFHTQTHSLLAQNRNQLTSLRNCNMQTQLSVTSLPIVIVLSRLPSMDRCPLYNVHICTCRMVNTLKQVTISFMMFYHIYTRTSYFYQAK